ncbi:hypothetical protein AOLI_G00006710 [Acnodon oligacanthus]
MRGSLAEADIKSSSEEKHSFLQEKKRCMEESTTMESSIGPHYSVSEDKMDGYLSKDPVLNSSMCDLSDEEISTKKENHLRLGPEDLNDTLLYDF